MKAFYDPADFPWTQEVLERYDAIRSEVEKIGARGMPPLYLRDTEPIEPEARRKPAWFSLGLIFFTIRNSIQLKRLPEIDGALKRIPNLVTANILKLEGNTHIKPHGGYTPDVLRLHLGVIVPEPKDGILRVDNERRHWEERKWLAFDDYLEHEVWYRGSAPRYVLMVDVVRPGVNLTPRQAAERFFTKAPGTRLDESVTQSGSLETWMKWLEQGEFSW